MSERLRNALARRTAVEEFYSPGQPRDKEGQFARVGKGFGKMSAHPDNRVRPTSKLTSDDFTMSRAKEIAKEIWGPSARVNDASGKDGFGYMHVTGTLKNKYDDAVGTYERVVKLAQDELVVSHVLLEIDEVYRGRGIATEWNAQATEQYRKLGVDHVDVHAANETGGYAWAREGFRALDTYDVITGANRQLEHAVETGRMDRPTYTETMRQLDALEAAHWAGEDVQPIHIASIGENTMRNGNTWPGKEALIGTEWHGAYYFDANDAITAAAKYVSEFYSPTQPRDKEGQWTAYRASITSLSRETLDRTLDKGLDAVFPNGSDTGVAPWPRAPRIKGQRQYDPDLVAEALRKPPVLEKVDPRILYATQPGLARTHVEYYQTDEYRRTGKTAADQNNAGNRFPVVYVNKKGQHLLLAGHHRALADMLAGRELDAIVVRE